MKSCGFFVLKQVYICKTEEGSTIINNLSYIYGNTNRLLQVEDTAHDTYGFKDDAIAIADTDDDYTYDANGNMISDTNKGITAISYNHLNLPMEIVFNNDPDQKINYVYTADGVKLQKIVNDGGSITTTDYAGNYTYENGNLKFINHAEGYLEPNGIGGFDYVYQYKDHLGNIRLSYSDRNNDGQISDTPIFEDNFESASGWESQGSLHGAAVDAYDNSFSHSGNYAARIDTPEGDAKYVHSNTWVTIDNEQTTAYTYSGWAYSDGPGIRVMLFMSTEEETDYYTQLDVFSDYETTNQWVYFEKTVMVPANIKRLNIRIESFWIAPGHVWFDDIQIKGQGSEIVEESNYYPFGLKHKGYNNSVNGLEYNYKTYNGKEYEESFGLNVIEMDFRQYDPALGRFNVVDPLAEERNWLSPYNFVQNNPILRIDPSGLLDDYGVDQNGKIELIKKTDDNTDTLYAGTTNENGEFVKDESKGSVTVDQHAEGSSLISDLSVDNAKVETVATGEDTTKERTSNITHTNDEDDAFNVFKFVADNSNVEWSLHKFTIDNNASSLYQIGTYHQSNISPGFNNQGIGTWLGGIHSHPGQNTFKDRIESMYGDRSRAINLLNKYGSKLPYQTYFPSTGTASRTRLSGESLFPNAVKVQHGIKNYRF